MYVMLAITYAKLGVFCNIFCYDYIIFIIIIFPLENKDRVTPQNTHKTEIIIIS